MRKTSAEYSGIPSASASPHALSSRYGVHVDLAVSAVSTPAVLPFPLFCGDGCRVQTAPGSTAVTAQTAPTERRTVASRHSRSAPDLHTRQEAEDGITLAGSASSGHRPGGRAGTADQIAGDRPGGRAGTADQIGSSSRAATSSRSSGRATTADQSGQACRRGGEKWWAQPGGKFAISPELMTNDIGLSTSDIQRIVRLRSAPDGPNVQMHQCGLTQQCKGHQHKPDRHTELSSKFIETFAEHQSTSLCEFEVPLEFEPDVANFLSEATLKKLQERADDLRSQIDENRRQGGRTYARSMTVTIPTQSNGPRAASPERGERPRHHRVWNAARQPKMQKTNPFRKYEDNEIKLQQKRRWLSEDPQYLADQISTLHQNRIHLWQDQKDLAEGQPGQAYEDRLFYNASAVHIRKQRNTKEQTEKFHQDAQKASTSLSFARRVAMLSTNEFDEEEDEVEYDEEKIALTAEILQSKVKGTATALQRLKGINDTAKAKLQYKDMRKAKLERQQHRHNELRVMKMQEKVGDSPTSKRDTLSQQAEESLSKAKKQGPLTCPQSMALYILKKRLKSSQKSLDKLCNAGDHHEKPDAVLSSKEFLAKKKEHVHGALRMSFSLAKKPQESPPASPSAHKDASGNTQRRKGNAMVAKA